MKFRQLTAVTLFCLLPHMAMADMPEKLSLEGATLTLNQTFDHQPVWRMGGTQTDAAPLPLNDESFSWAAGYLWNHPPLDVPKKWPPPKHDYPAWTSNTNANADPNGDMILKLGAQSSLKWAGTLNFTAQKMPPELGAQIDAMDPHDYMGASIISFPYSQTYGIFAMSAKLPIENGIWPAFWLLPADKSWPPEIDVMEVLGREGNKLFTTLHKKDGTQQAIGTDTHVDLSAGFHEYAVDWGPETMKWYFDGKLVFTQPTPSELVDKPCYILANIAVGKPTNWGGAPDAKTKLPATMQVAYIKAWQRPAYASK